MTMTMILNDQQERSEDRLLMSDDDDQMDLETYLEEHHD